MNVFWFVDFVDVDDLDKCIKVIFKILLWGIFLFI